MALSQQLGRTVVRLGGRQAAEAGSWETEEMKVEGVEKERRAAWERIRPGVSLHVFNAIRGLVCVCMCVCMQFLFINLLFWCGSPCCALCMYA
jgi:hypothetical protein